jgi:hypothetical protein
MAERIVLACLSCRLTRNEKTPNSQAGLIELIGKFKLCPNCAGRRVVQVAWVDAQGNMRTP